MPHKSIPKNHTKEEIDIIGMYKIHQRVLFKIAKIVFIITLFWTSVNSCFNTSFKKSIPIEITVR